MTYQEAKERFSKERSYLVNHDWKIAYYLAEQALEKQTPKKPVRSEEYVTGRLCPVCGKRLSIGYTTFCCDCGQALDWGDE